MAPARWCSAARILYGYPETLPIPASVPIQPINPYGYTKAAVEQKLSDFGNSEADWRIAFLRYFKTVGAHPSGRIREYPNGISNNLSGHNCHLTNCQVLQALMLSASTGRPKPSPERHLFGYR
jgi:UDP-glucose 4-epimerase